MVRKRQALFSQAEAELADVFFGSQSIGTIIAACYPSFEGKSYFYNGI
jgi:hypothetical protein